MLAEATLLEKWVYFFRNVSHLTAEEVVHRLQDSVFLEAAGVLEMIAQSPQERQMYEARLKFERDQIWRLKAAKDEGLERGELTGRIRVFQSLLGLPEASASELEALDIAQLTNLAAELRAQFQNRC